MKKTSFDKKEGKNHAAHIYQYVYKKFCLENIQRSKIKPEFTYIVQ